MKSRHCLVGQRDIPLVPLGDEVLVGGQPRQLLQLLLLDRYLVADTPRDTGVRPVSHNILILVQRMRHGPNERDLGDMAKGHSRDGRGATGSGVDLQDSPDGVDVLFASKPAKSTVSLRRMGRNMDVESV